jgi:hypothetical protein
MNKQHFCVVKTCHRAGLYCIFRERKRRAKPGRNGSAMIYITCMNTDKQRWYICDKLQADVAMTINTVESS